jgi:phage shock protein E
MNLDHWPVLTIIAAGGILGFWRFLHFVMLTTRLPQLFQPGTLVIDVRSPLEHLNGSRDRSVNYPLDQLDQRLGDVDRDTPIVLCCETGRRSKLAGDILKSRGFRNVADAGSCSNTVTS